MWKILCMYVLISLGISNIKVIFYNCPLIDHLILALPSFRINFESEVWFVLKRQCKLLNSLSLPCTTIEVTCHSFGIKWFPFYWFILAVYDNVYRRQIYTGSISILEIDLKKPFLCCYHNLLNISCILLFCLIKKSKKIGEKKTFFIFSSHRY